MDSIWRLAGQGPVQAAAGCRQRGGWEIGRLARSPRGSPAVGRGREPAVERQQVEHLANSEAPLCPTETPRKHTNSAQASAAARKQNSDQS